jgi:hypothetical protein
VKTLRGEALKPYEKPELPDERKVDAGLIEDGYKNLANGIEGV